MPTQWPLLPDNTFERRIFLVAVVLYLCTAWSSTGFHAIDEHYQVIAFAEAKAGLQPATPLPWEYYEGIRSAFLPTIAWGVLALSKAAGVGSPFVALFLLRALTALLALFAMRRFIEVMRHRIAPDLWGPFILLSYFLWFLPFQFVRFTGETWSGLFMLLAFTALLGKRGHKHSSAGLLFGLAFLCRPPTLLFTLGILLWVVVVKREKLPGLAWLCAGLVGATILGLGIDHWFYGKTVFTIWNYAKLGLFGSPDHPFMHFAWWYYPAWLVKYAIPPIGAGILIAFGVVAILKPRDPMIWGIVPFLALHLLLSHKDLRFLYPLVPFVPALLIIAWQELSQRKVVQAVPKHTWRLVLAGIALLNLAALAVVATSPAAYGSTNLARQLYQRKAEGPIKLYYWAERERVSPIYIPQYYLSPTTLDSIIADPCMPLINPTDSLTLLIADRPLPHCNPNGDLHWERVGQALPKWKMAALRAYEMEDHRPPWVLYERRGKGSRPVSSAP